jgi:mannosyl-oligosaccharide glucosidase
VLLLVLITASIASSPALEAFEKSTNQSLLWGAYRPNLYFGARPRLPDGILTALMWSKVEDYQSIQSSK